MSEAVRHLWWRLTAHSDSSEVVAYPPSWLFYTSNVLEDLIFNFQGTVKQFSPRRRSNPFTYSHWERPFGESVCKKNEKFFRNKKAACSLLNKRHEITYIIKENKKAGILLFQ